MSKLLFLGSPGCAVLLALKLGSCTAASAQTLNNGVGTGPSTQLATPLNADPINRPGAMKRALQSKRDGRAGAQAPAAAQSGPRAARPPRS